MHELLPSLSHNDITPRNIMLAPDGAVEIIDLGHVSSPCNGIAPFDTADLDICYSAGETFIGTYDAQSDIFAATAVLYTMLTGRKPWEVEFTDAMKRWYGQGVDAVFACGGGIYTSAAEAAAYYGGKVIGMDMDQAPVIDAWYGEDMTITSAVKAFTPTVRFLLDEIEADRFDRYAGEIRLGVGSPDPEESFVQLGASTLFNSGFTRDDYALLVERLYSGYYLVSNDVTCGPETFATAIAVKDYGDLK